MDWIRRNWPDLLIGVALVAVIALIVATLLSGGSMVSLFRRSTAPELPITTTTTPAGGQPQGNAGTGSNTPAAGPSTPETAGTAEDGNVDVFVPGLPDTSSSAATGAANNAATTPAEGGSNFQEASGTVAEPEAASVNAPLPEAIPNGGFRVAAGAVNSRDGAISSAETLREADYTVTIEQQDDLYLLWIGPYASRAGAERVAERLSADELVPDALVYSYDPDEATAEDDTSTPSAQSEQASNGGTDATATTATPAVPDTSASNTTAPDPDTAAPDVAATTPPAANEAPTASSAGEAVTTSELSAPDGQRFLQVGAFGSDESAQPQREQLEELGLSVTSRQDDNGVIRLYVGPFAGQQLAHTQDQLDTQGIDSFPVTP